MNVNNRSIGIFDSGLGGLTLFKELKKQLPHEAFIYLGDIAHLPYGNKSSQSIIKYSLTISAFLLSKKIKCLIVACNTASSVALKSLQKQTRIPIFNVIDPSIQEAIKISKTKKIAIIGTEATINSKTYQKKIYKEDKTIQVITRACPLFVPIVEEGLGRHRAGHEIARLYLGKIVKTKADTMILGCTHYSLMINTIKKVTQNKLKIINSSFITAKHIEKYLTNNKLQANTKSPAKDSFYVTDKPDRFNFLAQKILNKKRIKINKIIL